MEYRVLHAGNLQDLEEQVSSALVDGWLLVGGVAVNTVGQSEWFYQAVKRILGRGKGRQNED